MHNTIEFIGRIEFEPDNKTNKHNLQASWKRIAMVLFDWDVCHYYAWFIYRRYHLTLNPPLRGGHISFINDSIKDIGDNLHRWEVVKNKWNGKEIKVVLSVDARTDGNHWWLNIPEENRRELHGIRAELGLGRPHWGLHMTIGYANEKNIEHSRYILSGIRNGLIT